jgi:transcriptional regulator with XRE-family HTH domain
MPSIGETFKAAREAKGISLSEAGQATRIKTVQLEALERDDYRKIAAPTYARGFIKLYAQYLKLEPAPLLEEYNARHAQPNAGPLPASTAKPKPVPQPPPRPVREAPPAAPPPTATPPPPAYAPILPVAGQEPVAGASPSEPPAAVREFPLPTAEAQPAPAIEESPAFVPLVDVAPAPEAPPPTTARPAPERSPEVVEHFHPKPRRALPSDEERRAWERQRLRQAVVVIVGVLALVAVVTLIRWLVHRGASTTDDLPSSFPAHLRLIELPPEPYLEGR